jgi:sialate O-acetylesterase
VLVGLVASLVPSVARAQASDRALRLSRLVGDGMVMQRDTRVPVWGWGTPGTAVTVTFDGRPYSARVDAAGRWQVTLPAMPAGGRTR